MTDQAESLRNLAREADRRGDKETAIKAMQKLKSIESQQESAKEDDNYVWQETKRGAAGTLGLPADIVSFAKDRNMQKIRGVVGETPEVDTINVGGYGIPSNALTSEWWEALMGVGNTKPSGSTEAIAGDVANFVGGGGPINLGAGLAKRSIRPMLSGTGIDVSGGLFAGLGGQQFGVGGEVGGGLFGGMVVPSILRQRKAAIDKVREGVDIAKDPATTRPIATAIAGREMADILPYADDFTGPLSQADESLRRARLHDVEELKRSAEKLDAIPGLQPTVASVTGSPAAKSLEGKIARHSAADLRERELLDEANRLRLKEHATLTIPEPGLSGKHATASQRRAMTRKQSDIDVQLRKLDDEMDVTSQIDKADQYTVGDVIRKERAVEKVKLDAKKDELFGAVDDLAKKSQSMVDASGTLELAEQMMKDPMFNLDASNMPSVLSGVKDVAKGKGAKGVISFNDARKMLEEVTEDIGEEMVKGNRKRMRKLVDLKQSIEANLDNFGKSGDKELHDAYQAARAHYRDVYAPKLLKGINLKISRLNTLGDDRVLSENIVTEYFRPNGLTSARRFKDLYGENAVATRALESGVLDLYRQKVVRDGVIRPSLHKSFMVRYDSVLDEFPNIKRTLSDKDTALKSISERGEFLIKEREALANNVLIKHHGSGKNFNELIDSAIGSKKKMFELVYSVPKGDREAVVTSVWKRLYEKSALDGAEGIDGAKLKSLINENKEGLQIAFRAAWGKKDSVMHMRNLDEVADAAQILERGTLKGLTGIDESKGKGLLDLRNLSMALSQGRAVQTGRTGVGYAVGMTLGSMGVRVTKEQQHILTKELLYNPKLAEATAGVFRASNLGKPEKVAAVKKFLKHVVPVLKAFGGVQYYGDHAKTILPKLGITSRTRDEEQNIE